MINRIKNKIYSFVRNNILNELHINRLLMGKILAAQNKQKNISSLEEVEFKVFSQFGEDGIIQYLINKIPIENKVFIEFGVENYLESNTRFLLQNNNWSGLVIDGDIKNISYIKNDPIYWSHNLKAECAFITKDNINELIKKNGIKGDIGILSVDIDGNDYWVWEAIDSVEPRIVICEYNALFGGEEKISIPYKADFVWTNEHYSNLYWGASLAAFEFLGNKKGYSLIGVNSAGNNAFFVRNDLIENLKISIPKKIFKCSSIRQSRDERNELTFLSQSEALKLLSDCAVQKVDTLEKTKIKDLFSEFDEV